MMIIFLNKSPPHHFHCVDMTWQCLDGAGWCENKFPINNVDVGVS